MNDYYTARDSFIVDKLSETINLDSIIIGEFFQDSLAKIM
jgi:hypothetical protein